jgi:hypothetical protein
MSAAQTLERIALEADKEARSLRHLASQLRRLGAQVSTAIGATATGEDRSMLGYVRAVERDIDRAANALFTGAKEAREAAAEERRREEQQRRQQAKGPR